MRSFSHGVNGSSVNHMNAESFFTDTKLASVRGRFLELKQPGVFVLLLFDEGKRKIADGKDETK